MAKLTAGGVLDLISLSQAENKIGDIKQSLLSAVEFSSEHLGTWMLMNGQSCVGTAYGTLKGVTVVPDMTTEGTFLRQAKSGRAVGSYESDDNKSHNHIDGFAGVNTNASYGVTSAPAGNINSQSGTSGNNHAITSSTGSEARPKNIAANFFVKVGY